MLLDLPDESASESLADAFTQSLTGNRLTCGLSGPLGAGKSTLARAVLRVLGVTGPVPSPTYTLIEPYWTTIGLVHHVDLYRLSSDGQIAELGLVELIEQSRLILIEWPERDRLSEVPIDLTLRFEHRNPGRRVEITASSVSGERVQRKLSRQLKL